MARGSGDLARFEGHLPCGIASHSTEQDFYFGEDMLIRRHDYSVDIAGNFPAAQYVSDPVNVDGIRIPDQAPSLSARRRPEADARYADGVDRPLRLPLRLRTAVTSTSSSTRVAAFRSAVSKPSVKRA